MLALAGRFRADELGWNCVRFYPASISGSAMKRREFIMLGVGAVAARPLSAHAQQKPMSVIGYLSSSSRNASTSQLAGLREGLNETGFFEGRNVAIEYRWSEGRYDRLPEMAAELVNNHVSVILASGLPAVLAAKRASATIPIVFVVGADPVAAGLVPSLNRPDGNVTGISQFYGALGGKRLELLREIVPTAAKIAVLSDPNNPNADSHLNDVRKAVRTIGLTIEVATARTETEIDAAFATFVREKASALLVTDDPFFTVRREQIVALAARHRIPAIYYFRGFADVGGLISYGSSTDDNFHQAGVYVGRILNGTKPSELPVLQPTKFETVLNLKTAKSLGLTIPQSLLLLADEVIE
jgi:putative ABC transport system substrate-binding protein